MNSNDDDGTNKQVVRRGPSEPSAPSVNGSLNASQRMRQAVADLPYPSSRIERKIGMVVASADENGGQSMQVPYRPKDVKGSPSGKGKTSKIRRSKKKALGDEKTKLQLAPALAEEWNVAATPIGATQSRHSHPSTLPSTTPSLASTPGAHSIPHQPRDWKGSPGGAARRKGKKSSNGAQRHSMPELATTSTALTTHQGDDLSLENEPKGSPGGKRRSAKRRTRKSKKSIDGHAKTANTEDMSEERSTNHQEVHGKDTDHSKQIDNKTIKDGKIQSLPQIAPHSQSTPGAFDGRTGRKSRKKKGEKKGTKKALAPGHLELAPAVYSADGGLQHATVLAAHEDHSAPAVVNETIDFSTNNNATVAQVERITEEQSQQRQGDAFHGYVVNPLDEEERERIIEETRKTAETNFHQQVIEAVQVEGIRVRSRKEELVRSACLVFAVFIVTLAIVLGIIFGVVVKRTGDGGAHLENDICEGSIKIGEATLVGQIDLKTSSQQSIDNNITIPVCLSNYNHTTRNGSWYSLKGDGNFLHATTCVGNAMKDTTKKEEARASVNVFKGDSCAALACVETTSEAITVPVVPIDGISFCGESSTVFWKSENEVQYFLLVHVNESEESSTMTKSFEISVGRHTRIAILISYLESIFDGLVLDPPTSFDAPQYLAAKWLSEEDTFVPVPLQTEANRLELQQRYALLVLYFATNVPKNWRRPLGFLNSTVGVCGWNSGNTGPRGPEGAMCRQENDGIVTDLIVGMYLKL